VQNPHFTFVKPPNEGYSFAAKFISKTTSESFKVIDNNKNFIKQRCNSTLLVKVIDFYKRGLVLEKIKFYNAAPIWLSENINQVNYFAFLSRPKESKSKLVLVAEANNIDVGLFRY
jgi:hypothetical protein